MSPLDTLDALTGQAREQARAELLLTLLDEFGDRIGSVPIDPAIKEHMALLSGDQRERADQIKSALSYAISVAEGCDPGRSRRTILAILKIHAAMRELIFGITP